LHGTTSLLNEFVAEAPVDAQIEAVALPMEKLSYPQLATRLSESLQLDSNSVLIAESFSGPLAILLAERHRIAALVLCNTFAKHPYPKCLAALPYGLFARIAPPAALIRHYIVGPNASDALVARVREAVLSVASEILAFRLRAALKVDVTASLANCKVPIMYLRSDDDTLVREWSVRQIVGAATVAVTITRLRGPHLLLTTARHESWRAIAEFLSTLSSPSSAPRSVSTA
jgi:pimeloyl-[acyl-carrier protein] methyl ester esterase